MGAAIGSLKGPKHGGANIKVMEMLEYLKEGIRDWGDEDEVRAFLVRMINKQAGDRSGLVYGMGPRGLHPVRPAGGHPQEIRGGSGRKEGLRPRVPGCWKRWRS